MCTLAPSLLDLLRRAEPAMIGHFLHAGFMASAIRGLFPDVRIAGTAVIVQAPGAAGVMLHHAVGKAGPGDVLAMDRCGDLGHACVGGGGLFVGHRRLDGDGREVPPRRVIAPRRGRCERPASARPRRRSPAGPETAADGSARSGAGPAEG